MCMHTYGTCARIYVNVHVCVCVCIVQLTYNINDVAI